MMATDYTEAELKFMDRNTYTPPLRSSVTPSAAPATLRAMARPKPYYKPDTHKGKILAHLQAHGHLTNIHAIRQMGVMRLSERIREMQEDGFSIISVKIAPKVWDYRYTGHASDRAVVKAAEL